MAAIELTDNRYIGISVTVNRKPTNDFPILVNYGRQFAPSLPIWGGGIRIVVHSLMLISIALISHPPPSIQSYSHSVHIIELSCTAWSQYKRGQTNDRQK